MRHPDHAYHDSLAREAEREMARQEAACPRVCRLNAALLPVVLRMDYRLPQRHILEDVSVELLYRLDMAHDVTEEEEGQVMAGLEWVRTAL